MARLVAVPSWLSFSWWWLLAVSILANLCALHLKPISAMLDAGLILWPVVQAGWLKKASPSGTAIYWIAVGSVLGLALSFLMPGVVFGGTWWQDLITLGIACCYIAGVCFFIGDLKEYVAEMETYHPELNYVWAILFSTFYFQYKLHEIAADQQLVASRLAL